MNSSLLLTPNGKRRGRKPGLNSTVAQRSAANARERSRMRVLSGAFVELKGALPWVPKDTKLSKLDTLKLAAGYIAYLRRILDTSSDFEDKHTDQQNLDQHQKQQSEGQECESIISQCSIPETVHLFNLVAQTYEHPVESNYNLLSNYKQNNQLYQNYITTIQTNRNQLDSCFNPATDLESPSFTGDTDSMEKLKPNSFEHFENFGQFDYSMRRTTTTTNRDSNSISTDSDPSSTYLDLVYGEPTMADSNKGLNHFNFDGAYEIASRLFSPNKDQASNPDHFGNNQRNSIDPEFSRLFSPSMKSIWTGKLRYDDPNLLESGIHSDYACKIRVASSLDETVLSLCEASKQMESESMSIDPFLVKSYYNSTPSSLLQSAICFPLTE